MHFRPKAVSEDGGPLQSNAFGKYRIVAEIGRGGMGVVYLAEDTGLERLVALKLLPAALIADEVSAGRFMREARAAANLSHPSVVHVHAFDILEGKPFIEMEYVEGGSLAGRLREQFVSPFQAVHMVYDIAEALHYCHQRNAVHRDVKPSNILLDGQGRAKLADFGLAKIFSALGESALGQTYSSMFQGTPHYAPPEAWEAVKPSSAWDIYSLGAVMYEALAGATPYQASSPLELVRKMATVPPVPVRTENPQVSPQLGELVDQMLTADALARPSALEVLKRLETVPEFQKLSEYESETCQTPLTPYLKGFKPGFSRKRLRMGALGIAVVLALLLSCWVGMQLEARLERTLSTEEAPLMQAPSNFTASPQVEDILRASKGLNEGRTRIAVASFDGEIKRNPERWMLFFSEVGTPETIVCQSNANIALLNLRPGRVENGFDVIGGWAGYGDDKGTVMRHGKLSGSLQWSATSAALAGHLEYANIQDGTLLQSSFIATMEPGTSTDTRYIHEMEASSFVQPLLQLELLPRKLPWAREIQKLFPSIEAQELHSLFIQENSVTMDGKLEEPFWGNGGAFRGLHGVPLSTEAQLLAVHSQHSIFLGMSFPAHNGRKAKSIEIVLLRQYAVPQEASPVLHLSVDLLAQEIKAALGSFGTPLLSAPLPIAFHPNPERISMELEVPLSVFAPMSADMGEEEIWRLTAQMSDTKSEVVAWWGYPQLHGVHHGALLRFNAHAS